MLTRCAIVVPCYNESQRLPAMAFENFLDAGQTSPFFIFVDDGSRDQTLALLESIRKGREDRVAVLQLTPNRGKAEAVRTGMNYAFERDFPYAGFWDADLATPLTAIGTFADLLDCRPELDMVFGTRVKLLGRHVERRPRRHYTGRVFATAVSLVLRLPIYDTQCGAKLFRRTPQMQSIFKEAFLSRWIFDVEIIARYILLEKSPQAAGKRIYELPLDTWTDVKGSKLKPTDFIRAAYDLFRIYRKYQP
jgi:dolichyl-phosphate beta-glucosyltransferase